MYRTHSCGELRLGDAGKEVTLAGWVHRRRDHGGLAFIDLRDRSGIVQVVFNPQTSPSTHALAGELRNEWVVKVVGEVARRPKGTENPRLPTGDVEVVAKEGEVLNPSKTPPFYINEEEEVDENVRLKYRYLDLRRPRMLANLVLRHKVVKFIRDFLDARGFLEVETPILIKSTPEGARDYVVPSRVQPGRFYALPQSPQQLKQLLMVAGIEKYFQIARCFRDEDLRADRQPEFTQLDLEMSFVDESDVLSLIEELMTSMVETLVPQKRMIKPFPRFTWRESMERYGTDKPDLRFGMELADVSDIAVRTQFNVFQTAVKQGGIVKGLALSKGAVLSRKQMEELTEFVRIRGAKGLITIALEGEGSLDSLTLENVRSVVARHLSIDEIREIALRLGGKPGDLLLIEAGDSKTVNLTLSQLRHELGRQQGLADPDLFAFAYVTDFPLFEWNEQEKRWDSAHHPFTAAKEEDIPLLDTEPGKVRSKAYDLVCNGSELSSGSIRIHRRELQEKIFKILGYSAQDAQAKFGHLLEAFEYGAPPHGGIAPGIDRIVMILAGEDSLREVIAFPKTQSAMDLMTDAPSPISEAQLKELHLRIVQ